MNENFMTESEIETKVEKITSQYQNHTQHMFIDITGDLVSGTLLSQILYWFAKDKNGNSRVRIFKDGYYWIAKNRSDWYNEIRITKRQYDTAINLLSEKGFVKLAKYKYNSMPTIHIRPNYDVISLEIKKWKDTVRKGLLSGNVNEALREEYEDNFGKNKKSKLKKPGNDENVNTSNNENVNTGITNKEILLTMTTNNDYLTETTDSNKVFSQEEKTNYNKAFSGEKAYRSPDISYEYTEKEFKEFITKKVDHIVKEISPEEYDTSVEPISAIIAYFYKRYYKCMGKRHPILTDAAYTKIIMKLIEPVEDVWKRDFRLDKTVYYAMIDQFFKTDYGVKSGNITDYRMSYFMSDTVQSNLVYRSGIV